jgi:hypothetical protein
LTKNKLNYLLRKIYSFPLVLGLLTLFNVKIVYTYMKDIRLYTLILEHINTLDKVLKGKRMLVNINIETLSEEEIVTLKKALEEYFREGSK